MSERLRYSIWDKRPWTESILGPLTPWKTKVADLVCDTCGKVVMPDIILGELYFIIGQIEIAERKHFKEMWPREMPDKKRSSALFVGKAMKGKDYVIPHSKCTLKWIPEIERKLKQQGVF
jgi:hypothetical protein